MKIKLLTPIVFLSACLFMGAAMSHAEDQQTSSGCAPGGHCQPPSEQGNGHREHFKKKMMERFDVNKDGKLDDAEKAAMEKEMKERRGKGGHHQEHHEGQGNPPPKQ
jgi:hypothetical protein